MTDRTSEYEIRRFRPADRDGFLRLFSVVFDEHDHRPGWFSWKYRSNPYADEVPIVVAESDGELVGARPFFALGMAIDGTNRLALQPCDTMVHPDHRRKGLFTRMTERAIDRYERGKPAFFFNFPNERSRPGYRKLGWRPVGQISRWYRFQNPEPVFESYTEASGGSLAGRATTPLVTGYNKVRELTATDAPDVSVRREESVPVTELAERYRERVPDGIHAVRDERFYEWRFENPDYDYATYLSTDGGESVGLVVGRSAAEAGTTIARVVDVVPLSCRDRSGRMAALLDAVLDANADADLVIAPDAGLPAEVLRERGFHSEGSPPLSYLRDGRTHVVRSLTGWDAHPVDLRRRENWLTTFAEFDTS